MSLNPSLSIDIPVSSPLIVSLTVQSVHWSPFIPIFQHVELSKTQSALLSACIWFDSSIDMSASPLPLFIDYPPSSLIVFVLLFLAVFLPSCNLFSFFLPPRLFPPLLSCLPSHCPSSSSFSSICLCLTKHLCPLPFGYGFIRYSLSLPTIIRAFFSHFLSSARPSLLWLRRAQVFQR